MCVYGQNIETFYKTHIAAVVKYTCNRNLISIFYWMFVVVCRVFGRNSIRKKCETVKFGNSSNLLDMSVILCLYSILLLSRDF